MLNAVHKEHKMTHEDRVKLYVKAITNKCLPLTEFKVNYMRNAAPSRHELSALNDALVELGWQR
jgi:hypothetical protein